MIFLYEDKYKDYYFLNIKTKTQSKYDKFWF